MLCDGTAHDNTTRDSHQMKSNYGHRWTHEELTSLIGMWQDDAPLSVLAEKFNTTTYAIGKTIQRLRKVSIPLKHRVRGNNGKTYRKWTQSETEYLIRRRASHATCEEIANELNRSANAVNGMVQKLARENVPIVMRGDGRTKLYNIEELKLVAEQNQEALPEDTAKPQTT